MSGSINKVMIIGNVGQDPETKFTQSGAAIANFSVATSKNWKDKQTGESKEKTEWHRISCYNKLADFVSNYVTKGKKVYVEGELETVRWQDQAGNDKQFTRINAFTLKMLSPKDDNAYTPAPAPAQGYQSNNYTNPNPANASTPEPPSDFDGDDIPF